MHRVRRWWYGTKVGHWLYERRRERERLADWKKRLARAELDNKRAIYRRYRVWPKR